MNKVDIIINKIIVFMVVKLHLNDKKIHALANLLIILAIGFFELKGAIYLAAGFSGGKEVGDYFNPNSHGYFGDIVADVIGILIGVTIILIVRSF